MTTDENDKTEGQLAQELAAVEKAAEAAIPVVPGPASPEAIAAAKAEKPPEPVYDPRALQLAFDKTTRTGPDAMSPGGGDIIPRRRLEFVIDASELAPDVFAGDIKITLAALSSAMELKAVDGVTDAAAAGVLTSKASLELLNDAPIPLDQLDFVWEALGPGGRQIVMTMYQQIGALTPVGLGKAQASSTKR